MVDVQRIWRITTSEHGDFEIRLIGGGQERRVVLEQIGTDPSDQPEALDLDVARALAETMLEACEVASALSESVPAAR